jgi:hypothetical protein
LDDEVSAIKSDIDAITDSINNQTTDTTGTTDIDDLIVSTAPSKNLLDPDTIVANTTINTTTGKVTTTTVDVSTSGIMSCSTGDTIYVTRVKTDGTYISGTARRIAIYDENESLLATAEYPEEYTVTSENAKYFRVMFTGATLSGSEIVCITLNDKPTTVAEITEYFKPGIVLRNDNFILNLIEYLPANFYSTRRVDNVQIYINDAIMASGNKRYSIVFPEGDFYFTDTAKLPYKVSVVAHQGTVFHVADSVTAFEWNGALTVASFPMSTIYDADGCAFDGGGCRFLLGSNSVGIKVNGVGTEISTTSKIRTSFARRYIDNISFKGTGKTSIGIWYVTINVYLVKHRGLQFSFTTCIRWGDGTNARDNAGENMSFHDCTFSHVPFSIMASGGSFRCVCCSFDFCERFATRDDSTGAADFLLTDCHMERHKVIGGTAITIRGNTSYFAEPGSNEYDPSDLPLTVSLTQSSMLVMHPIMTNTDVDICSVINSPYIKFTCPRKISYMLLNKAQNLISDDYDGTESVSFFHDEPYIGGRVDVDDNSDLVITVENQLTRKTTTLTIYNDTASKNRILQALDKGIYTLTCSKQINGLVLNSLG